MANALFKKWPEALMQASSNSALTGNIKLALIDHADDTPNVTTDDMLDDIDGAAIVATSGNFASKTYTNGTFDAADITLTAVTGDQAESIVIYIDTGTASTSRLVAYFDTATGLPVTPNGGDITVTWNVSGIISLAA